MGIYDRDYQRGGNYDYQPGFNLGGARTLTTNLVIVMFAIFAVQLATRGEQGDDGAFTNFLSLHADLLKRPWKAFELLTYGFLHDPWNFQHIIFNMIALWFFGRPVENRYGKQEFLAFFLVAVIFAGLTWLLGDFVAHRGLTQAQMLGASGGIAAVLVLFCLNFPHQIIYIWGVIPVPAWLCAILFIGIDVLGAMGHHSEDGGNVAFTAHLGGALFGFLYFQWGWRLARWLPSGELMSRLKPSPKLRVHDPEDAEETERQVDEILKKIQEHGRDSLTRSERRLLEEASREYQKKRR